MKKKFLIIVLIILLLILPVMFSKKIQTNESKNLELANVKSNITINGEEEKSQYSEEYQKWLNLSEQEKENIAVIPREYDVPLDIVYERIEQVTGTYNQKNLPNSYILLGEDTNNNGITDENDIKVDSYGGIKIKVENQAGSSLCWAFASMNSIETNLLLNNNGEFDFSERHLDYLQSDLFIDSWRSQDAGGNFTNFEDYIISEQGPVLEKEVPYDSRYSGISDFEYLESLLQRVKVDEENFINMPSINKSTTSYTKEELQTFRTLVKEHIMKNGSLEASIYSQALVSSVDKKNQVLNYQSDHIADHSISIIGWDDNFSKENFPNTCRPNNDGAYIALNSYGEEWGNCGIFYISYDDILVEESMNGVSDAYVLDVLDIYVETEPINVNYISNEKFDTKGMTVKAKYQNEEEKEIAEYTISPEIITSNTEYITIYYTEGNTTKTTTQKINVYDYKDYLNNGIKVYEDIANQIMFISGEGNTYIDFENYELKKIILEDGIKGISSVNSNNLNKLDSIYMLDKEGAISDNFIINDNVTVYCYKDSTTKEYCESNNITYFGFDDYYKCGKSAYAFVNKNENKMVISGAGNIYEFALNEISWKKDNEYIKHIEIDNDITNISKKLFAENANIQTVKLGNSIVEIGEYAFYNCINLSEVELNENLEIIGKCVFYNCTSLPSINIHDNVEKIGEYCFYNCVSLEDVKLSSKMTTIETYLFYNCTSLKEINLHDSIRSLYSRAFMNCTSLKKIKIPKELGPMSNWTFANCTSLKEVDFSDSNVYQIGDATFNGCSSIESFIMPDTITSISQGIFGKCTALKNLEFSHGLTRLWSGVAQNCTALEEVSVPYGIKIMGDGNFLGGTNLKKVTFPCSLETIGNNTFSSCHNLQYLIIPNSLIISENTELLGYTRANPTIYCKSDSSIKEYAIKKGIKYEIDDTKPTLEVIQQELESGAKKLTIKAYDNNDIVGLSDYPYSFDGGLTWQAEPDRLIDQDSTLTICVRDGVGNIATQKITVNVIDISKISIKEETLNKTDYYIGDTLDTKGLVLIATNINGEITEVTEGYVCTPQKLSRSGTQTITVTYGGKTTTFNVTVQGNGLSKIEIAKKPNKIAYYVGEMLDTTGLELKGIYSNGRTGKITNGFTCTQQQLNIPGTQTITVKYSGKTTTFDVIVREVKVSKIEIIKEPSKLSYYVGDALDTTGLILKGTYNNVKTEEITEGYTCTSEKLETAGTQTITVTYEGKTTTFTVTVIEKFEVNFKEYQIEENTKSYIKNIVPNTTIKELKDNIETNGEIEILKDSKVVDEENTKLATGMELRITYYNIAQRYIIVVKGDVNGDAKADINDIFAVNKHRLNRIELKDEYLLASDYNNDGKTDIFDIFDINKIRLKK